MALRGHVTISSGVQLRISLLYWVYEQCGTLILVKNVHGVKYVALQAILKRQILCQWLADKSLYLLFS